MINAFVERFKHMNQIQENCESESMTEFTYFLLQSYSLFLNSLQSYRVYFIIILFYENTKKKTKVRVLF